MTVRSMDTDDLNEVLIWAADEGWNPGLDDAKAFHAADPGGFLVKEVNGKPVAAISVVNHDLDFAFLGLYLCKPQYRGQGHGMDVWRAGLAHAGARSIGLDGVPDQQANYARSGFVKSGSTIRFQGSFESEPVRNVRPASPDALQYLIARDMAACGMQRKAFATTWFSQGPTRQTVVLGDETGIKGYATFRRCGEGTKVGPLCAQSERDARALLASNPFSASKDPVFIDVQGQESALVMMLKQLGFEAVFETARMFSGSTPVTEPVPFQAIATMELG